MSRRRTSRAPGLPAAAVMAGGFTSAHRALLCVACGAELVHRASDGSQRCEVHLAPLIGPRLPDAEDLRGDFDRARRLWQERLHVEHEAVGYLLRHPTEGARLSLEDAHAQTAAAWEAMQVAWRRVYRALYEELPHLLPRPE